MTSGRILCIVEGDGEREAIPALVNRIIRHLRRDRLVMADPVRVICTHNGDRITAPYEPARQLGVEYFVARAAREKPSAILVIVDAEDRCLKRTATGGPPLGPELLARAQPAAGGIPVGVVIANRMFESWLLADFHSLRARGQLPAAAQLPPWRTPEAIGGCKGWLRDLLGRPYSETRDQPRLAQEISLPRGPALKQRAPSFAKLLREVDRISRAALAARRREERG